ncbi:MAG TPA: ribulose-phosphate 3-epimerase [Dehalococcoidia bacterium]|nr:ribulose-phosphate 3-epimerase [Dehalococcoidia bacterium]
MKSRHIKIAPSILSADFGNLADQIKQIELAMADYIHIDVMDGHFVPNMSIGLPVVESLKKYTQIPLDVHLMIANPSMYIHDFAKAGADIITVHVETDPHMHRLLESIKTLHLKAGLALNPSTPLNTLDELLPYADLFLIMSVNPGFGGQKFISGSLQKISNLRKMLDDKESHADLQVDGGISNTTILDVVKAGADVIVAGSSIFHSRNIAASINELRDLANSA